MARRLGRTEGASRRATASIVALSLDQHGVVGRRQLLEIGLTSGLINGRVARGLMAQILRGVYAVGNGVLSRQGRWMAAVLAAGRSAVLSHGSAAELHGLIKPRSSAIEVTRTGGGRAQLVSIPQSGIPGFTVIAHRTRSLSARDVTEVDGIPVTSVARTSLDMASGMELQRVKSVLSEGERRRSFDRSDLTDVLERSRGRRGSGRLRQALREWDPLEVEARSVLEEALLQLCRDYGIPMPLVNQPIGEYVVDFLWPDAGLVVEVDGFEHHSGRREFHEDRIRDVELQLAGFRVARFSYASVVHEPFRTATRILGLLDATPTWR